MYIGSQYGAQTDAEMQVLSQLGIKNVDQTPTHSWKDWTTDMLKGMKEQWAQHDISMEMIHIPLGSRSAYDNEAGAIFLKASDARDRQIDWMKETVRMAGEAGVRGLNYNITILGHLRTPSKTGRGGATVSTFELDKLAQSLGPFKDGPADEDEMWERIDHWLQEIIPVAEEYKVQMACHPSDPGIGVGNTYQGVARPLGMVEGFKKLIELYDSPYNGLNFCQGCMSEALENPAEEIFDVIRYFGERKKIFNVHFRNIKGGLGNFVEVFPDEGDINMIKALKVYQDVGYEYMIMPDHVPGIGGPESGKVGFAYTYGYIHAALQAVKEL